MKIIILKFDFVTNALTNSSFFQINFFFKRLFYQHQRNDVIHIFYVWTRITHKVGYVIIPVKMRQYLL